MCVVLLSFYPMFESIEACMRERESRHIPVRCMWGCDDDITCLHVHEKQNSNVLVYIVSSPKTSFLTRESSIPRLCNNDRCIEDSTIFTCFFLCGNTEKKQVKK